MQKFAGLAKSLSEDDGAEQKDSSGNIVEDKSHEDRQEGKMDQILAIVTEMKAKLDALIGAEDSESEEELEGDLDEPRDIKASMA